MGEWYTDMWNKGLRFHYVVSNVFTLSGCILKRACRAMDPLSISLFSMSFSTFQNFRQVCYPPFYALSRYQSLNGYLDRLDQTQIVCRQVTPNRPALNSCRA
jgi:hypothetical protein